MNGGNWWQDSRRGWLPFVLPPEMCIGSLAHPYRTPDNEPWRGPLTIRAQPLIRQLRPASVWSHYYYTMLLTLYVRMFCLYYYCYSSIVIITITIIPFLTTPPVINSRYSCVCTFEFIIYSNWSGPRIQSKRLNQVTSTSSCDFWLVEFPIILIPVQVWWFSHAINILHNMKNGGLVLYYY